MAGVVAAAGGALAGAVGRAVEAVRTEAIAVIANLISLIKVVLMYCYEWMQRFWAWFSENPIGGVTFLANVYIFMS